MDKLTFKIQANRASQALVIQSSDITKRALLKTLHSDAIMAGTELVLIAVELDDTADQNVKSMTFGLRGSPLAQNITEDTILENVILAGRTLVAVLIVNTTEHTAFISIGTTPGGSDICKNMEIKPGLNTIGIINTFSLTENISAYINHASEGDAFNGASLNVTFIF